MTWNGRGGGWTRGGGGGSPLQFFNSNVSLTPAPRPPPRALRGTGVGTKGGSPTPSTPKHLILRCSRRPPPPLCGPACPCTSDVLPLSHLPVLFVAVVHIWRPRAPPPSPTMGVGVWKTGGEQGEGVNGGMTPAVDCCRRLAGAAGPSTLTRVPPLNPLLPRVPIGLSPPRAHDLPVQPILSPPPPPIPFLSLSLLVPKGGGCSS